MIYNISGESLNNPLLKELLKELTIYFNSINTEFYIIGATARDIILSSIHNQQPSRKTDDLDIAIAIPDWGKFEEISEGLCNAKGFSKSTQQKQRFFFNEIYKLDVVPFGEIAKQDQMIYWPPEENQAMSVVGFTEVAKQTLEVMVDNDFIIRLATLPGIFILKLSAFKDRYRESNKDAEDIAFILSNYLDINIERAVQEHADIYELEDFSEFVAGAMLLGRDIHQLLERSDATTDQFIQILQEEIKKEEESYLINQMMETNRSLNFNDVLRSLDVMVNELKK